MRRTPSTRRGTRTRDTLLEHAATVFTRKGFHGTSVAAVCRAAGVANGSFYQYFTTKREVFDAIVEEAREGLETAASEARDPADLCNRLFDFFEGHGASFQVFREAEFLEEADASRAFYRPVVASIRKLLGTDEAAAWALLGSATFTALHYALWRGSTVPSPVRLAFADLALHGLSPVGAPSGARAELPPPRPRAADEPGDRRAERTRSALVTAARHLFAERGYAATKIADVTGAAGVALGTFYVHFRSKRELLAHLVDDIRGLLTARVQEVSSGVDDRLEVERRNLLAFLDALTRNGDIYRIVREAEFAEPSIGRGYYETIAQAYADGLTRGMGNGTIRPVDAAVGAWFVMGLAHTAGMRFVLWEGCRPAPAAAVASTLRVLLHGVTP